MSDELAIEAAREWVKCRPPGEELSLNERVIATSAFMAGAAWGAEQFKAHVADTLTAWHGAERRTGSRSLKDD